MTTTRVYCGNVPAFLLNTSGQAQLLRHLQRYGQVISVDVNDDPVDPFANGFAFVTYGSLDAAQRAVDALKVESLDGTMIVARMAIDRGACLEPQMRTTSVKELLHQAPPRRRRKVKSNPSNLLYDSSQPSQANDDEEDDASSDEDQFASTLSQTLLYQSQQRHRRRV